MNIEIVRIDSEKDVNTIIGTAHFIKTVEDIYEALVNSTSTIKFGIAFCESSGLCLVRHAGNDKKLEKSAIENALAIGAGHSFIIFLKNNIT